MKASQHLAFVPLVTSQLTDLLESWFEIGGSGACALFDVEASGLLLSREVTVLRPTWRRLFHKPWAGRLCR